MEKSRAHFILVHGACNGAWCWYKLATLLRSKGYQVTNPDLAASGVNLTRIEEVNSISQYSQPLMDIFASLPYGEKVILVGHSFGGFSVSLAMERFPDKIAVAAFVAAFMPGPDLVFRTLLDQYNTRLDSQLDNQSFFHNGPDKRPTSFVFGNEFLALNLYQNSPLEDLTLAKTLKRPSLIVTAAEDFAVSEDKYGSVPRVYIVANEDRLLKPDFQTWMIENNPTGKVKKIEGADHMVMLSKPLELCVYLQDISETYT